MVWGMERQGSPEKQKSWNDFRAGSEVELGEKDLVGSLRGSCCYMTWSQQSNGVI